MKRFTFFTVLMVLLLVVLFSTVSADGTETLGVPSIPIASGTGFVAAGTGLFSQPGTIEVTVPSGTINQVLLYWSGSTIGPNPIDDTIEINGNAVTGALIGGPTFFFNCPAACGPNAGPTYYSARRADITGLGLVSAGTTNTLTVGGMSTLTDGAGVLVIFDDGSGAADIQVRDGMDLAFIGFPDPRQTTVPQTFTFAAGSSDRTADLVVFAGSVGAGRPNAIKITVNGTETLVVNQLGSVDGELWDTLTVPVNIPAGATSLTVQALSYDDGSGRRPASLSWIGAGLSVPPADTGEGCTPGFWRNKLEDWAPTGLNPDDDFDTTFGVDFFDPDITLEQAVNARGGGLNKVARHGTAALLNVLHPDVDYPLSEAEVIAAVQSQDVEELVGYNELLSDICE